MESEKYITEQLITYIGNKRSLLNFIGESINDVKKELGQEKIITFDGFAGSGVVSRYLKQYSTKVYSNDLEKYSHLVTKSYLTNKSEIDPLLLNDLVDYLNNEKFTNDFGVGIIEELYSPRKTNNIKKGERCFFTNENAKIIDNIRRLIDNLTEPQIYKDLLLSNLIHKASVHTNTSGVFKGFYKSKNTGKGMFGGDGKNALQRIMGEITLETNVLSNFECEYMVFNEDINTIIKKIDKVNLTYFDPPYNQHPYGSNYHILNTILTYQTPKDISNVSGIPKDWNKSDYNYKDTASDSLNNLIKNTNSDFILLSYNNEGIIPMDKVYEIMSSYGDLELRKKEYNTFKGSRNLKDRSNKVNELLYVLRKK
jgi:adenine-specific DNA-methyltransferase